MKLLIKYDKIINKNNKFRTIKWTTLNKYNLIQIYYETCIKINIMKYKPFSQHIQFKVIVGKFVDNNLLQRTWFKKIGKMFSNI